MKILLLRVGTDVKLLPHIDAVYIKALVISLDQQLYAYFQLRSPPLSATPAQRLLSLVHTSDCPAKNFLRCRNK